MDIEEFHHVNEKIKNSFSAVKQDMLALKENLVKISQAVAANQEFEDEANIKLNEKEEAIEELGNKILSLKEELHNEQLQNKRSLNNLQKNFDSVYIGIDSYKKEAEVLHEENKKLKMLIETLMQEIVRNRDISTRELKNLLDSFRIEASLLKEGMIKFKNKKRRTSPNTKQKSWPKSKVAPIIYRNYVSDFEKPKHKGKNFFSRIIDYFTEE